MRTFLFLSLFATLLLSLNSCVRESSDSVDQDRIFTDYELYYNANEDKTYARATFRFSNALGTKLELAAPSEVTFDGDLLTFNQALAYYEKTLAGFVQSGVFEWKDTEGNVFTNTISINEIGYPVELDTIVRSGSYDLIWTGDPLGDHENVTLTANGENEADAQLFFTNDTGAQNIVLGKDKLEKIGAGPGTLFMDRRYQPALSQATGAGGLLTGRYRPENAEVVFE
ncbi:MAG: hypothetical protein KDC32_23540 [Saprospiraceae bacterium]|nr:hypothetical protein [Saprospiraceae bacterium]